ncbi:unnamed protein product [Dibothriocephalus latus]|uniref:U2A'/phosphoprotein 32 family A C-terminal domain-containing protein n=1 Tax=Dibothriocephalus latus TaxID=60516 RepID=A0A3P7MEQ1_DIBLA|nr:unnamed protein product [Dibothriocephalus latus]
MENLVNLEELYISSNGIAKIENLEKLTKIQTLDLAFNRVTHLENLEALVNMEEFWFNDNRVAEWDQLKALVPLKSLQTLYMERNPLYYTADGKKDSGYRRKILLLLPELRQLDATLTGVGLRTG